jgi:sRNA-binding carbon storage regulator CsrA
VLIVTVKEHEEVVLSRDGVELGTVTVRVRGDGRVRIGLDFPKEVRIARKELDARAAELRGKEGGA